MRINNPLAKQQISQPGPLHGGAERMDGTAPPDSSLQLQSPELTDWLRAMRDTPDLRPEVVQNVVNRLANGEFSTAKAVEQTVQAMLGTALAGR
ncbi:MAG TPA: hypothetical protein VK395_18350 [Gemmataceae bacterium]|nr:hypothetical protein [Gemmataceae bacterium]